MRKPAGLTLREVEIDPALNNRKSKPKLYGDTSEKWQIPHSKKRRPSNECVAAPRRYLYLAIGEKPLDLFI
mgnify:CR=1 FL=1